MAPSLTYVIGQLFLKEKSHRLALEQIYESVKDDFPDKNPFQVRHSIRRAIQNLTARGTVRTVEKGVYILNEN